MLHVNTSVLTRALVPVGAYTSYLSQKEQFHQKMQFLQRFKAFVKKFVCVQGAKNATLKKIVARTQYTLASFHTLSSYESEYYSDSGILGVHMLVPRFETAP
jgi:hypothetical protein